MPNMPDMPCGVPFCAAALRLMWPLKEFRLTDIGAVQGCTPPAVCRRADVLGIWDLRPHGRVSVFSVTRLRQLWADDRLTNDQIAATLNLHPRMLSQHARSLGLPQRRMGQKQKVRFGPEFEVMWNANVLSREIARHYGCRICSVEHEVRRRGLQRRRRCKGWLAEAKTLDQFREWQLGQAMARTAAETEAVLKLAEMVDSPARMMKPTMARAA